MCDLYSWFCKKYRVTVNIISFVFNRLRGQLLFYNGWWNLDLKKNSLPLINPIPRVQAFITSLPPPSWSMSSNMAKACLISERLQTWVSLLNLFSSTAWRGQDVLLRRRVLVWVDLVICLKHLRMDSGQIVHLRLTWFLWVHDPAFDFVFLFENGL